MKRQRFGGDDASTVAAAAAPLPAVQRILKLEASDWHGTSIIDFFRDVRLTPAMEARIRAEIPEDIDDTDRHWLAKFDEQNLQNAGLRSKQRQIWLELII